MNDEEIYDAVHRLTQVYPSTHPDWTSSELFGSSCYIPISSFRTLQLTINTNPVNKRADARVISVSAILRGHGSEDNITITWKDPQVIEYLVDFVKKTRAAVTQRNHDQIQEEKCRARSFMLTKINEFVGLQKEKEKQNEHL